VDAQADTRDLHFVEQIVRLPAAARVDVFGPPRLERHRAKTAELSTP